MMKNIFDKFVTDEVLNRINSLTPEATPQWGKMSVDQMLAHCNVAYEFIYETKHEKPKGFKKWMLKTFVKPMLVSDKPFKKNSRTSKEFLITSQKDFTEERKRLCAYIIKTQELGGTYFDQKESPALGPLTQREWSNLLYKHLDHHLVQFGV